MIFFEAEGIFLLALLALWLFALVDCISTDASVCRNLPKAFWVVIVLFLPDIGSILWLMLGRPERARWTPGSTDYSAQRRPVGFEDHPRYSAIAGVTDRRSAELDEQLARWEREEDARRRRLQRAQDDPEPEADAT